MPSFLRHSFGLFTLVNECALLTYRSFGWCLMSEWSNRHRTGLLYYETLCATQSVYFRLMTIGLACLRFHWSGVTIYSSDVLLVFRALLIHRRASTHGKSLGWLRALSTSYMRVMVRRYAISDCLLLECGA